MKTTWERMELLGRARAAMTTSEAGYINPHNTSVVPENKKGDISSWISQEGCLWRSNEQMGTTVLR